MLVKQIVQVAALCIAIVLDSNCDAATTAVKLCGRELGEIMSKVCHVYNSPTWDVPTVVEQPAAAERQRRSPGIADECCLYGCTWEQLSSYCYISAKMEVPMDSVESHSIADRSAEEQAAMLSPAAAGHEGSVSDADAAGRRGEVGRGRSHGYGRARGRRCGCRRKRRSGRRRASLMGNMDIKNVVRAAPVFGTVSPLLTWGRTLNTDLPTPDTDRYAYYAVYA